MERSPLINLTKIWESDGVIVPAILGLVTVLVFSRMPHDEIIKNLFMSSIIEQLNIIRDNLLAGNRKNGRRDY